MHKDDTPFYIPSDHHIIKESLFKPFLRPLNYGSYIILLFIFFGLLKIGCDSLPYLETVEKNILTPIVSFFYKYPFLLFDAIISLFMSFFIINMSIDKQSFFESFVLIMLIFLLTHTMMTYNDETILFSTKRIFESIHLVLLWIFFFFFFTYLCNRYFIDVPFRLFLNMHTHTITNIDLFSPTKEITEHHKKDDIYIDVIPLTEKQDEDENFNKIQTMYLRLVKFWYAQKYYTFKLRYFFPLLITFASLIYFFYLLDFINDIPTDSNNSKIEFDQQYGLMMLSLTILYFTMSHHIHNFLNSRFYMNSIVKELNKIYFDHHQYRQQILLFLDSNLLIYIHDRNQDTHFCLNESKDFKEFINEERADEEGRNLIVMVYISFFMILFIEIMANRYQPPPSPVKKSTLTVTTQQYIKGANSEQSKLN